MELEFRKHFRDATSLLLMMDHDSGYVEGVETTSSSSNESSKEVTMNPCSAVPQNIYLSEDALLEKPDISFDWTVNLPYDINPEDHEESRRLFFSPEVIEGSEPSQEVVYSGLENDSESESSAEIPHETTIKVNPSFFTSEETEDKDVLTISASERDLSLEIEEPSSVCFYNDRFLKCLETTQTQTKEGVTNSFDGKLPTVQPNSSKCHTPLKKPQNNVTQNEHSPNLPSTSQQEPKTKKKLTLVFSKKKDTYSVKRKYPSLTPEKQLPKMNCTISPDIFDDEIIPTTSQSTYFEPQKLESAPVLPITQQKGEKLSDKLDQKLLKRITKSVTGVLPPPSLTVVHMSADDILGKLELNKSYWFWNSTEENGEKSENNSLNSSKDSGSGFSKSLLLTGPVDDALKAWPDVVDVRTHGLHYNCGKTSEEIVDLCDKYQKRCVSAETQSTCTIFESHLANSPSKRKNLKPRWGGKSPGRRLSHLARRRITFSSSNLQGNSSSIVGSRARQILVDAKKIELLNRRRSPKKSPRKTPRKTPSTSPKLKTRTPSSSAKKKLAMRFRKLTGEIEKSVTNSAEVASSVSRTLFKSPVKAAKSESRLTKRTLFQSPSRDNYSSLLNSSNLQRSGEKSQLRRALFTSPSKGKKSPMKHGLWLGYEKKRKRSESDDVPQTSKFARSMSMDVKPVTATVNKSVIRTQSEMNISLNKSQSELSEQHKKKLLWAVSGALQSKNITSTHPQWKVFASVLARVTKRFFTSQMTAMGGARSDVGTTERMHRIARYHVISVIKGKSVDEIVAEYLKNRASKVPQRPQGYVPPETKTKAPSGGKENVFQDRVNTIESWEKRRMEQQGSKPVLSDNRIERIRKVIRFGDDF